MVKKGIYEEVDANLIQTISDHFDSVVTTASIVAVRTNALGQLAPASRAAAPH
jgi:hypothetical protein